MKLTGQPKLSVKVLSPTKTLFDGVVYAVSAINKTGPFDILADHANFFSMLEPGDITVMTTPNLGDALKLPIAKGLIKVHDNKVTFFVDIEPVAAETES